MPAEASSGSVLVTGSINTDLVVRVPRAPMAGETVTGDQFDVFGGGKGANQALASVRSGVPTTMLGAVGQDDFGRQRLDDLKANGVNCAHVATVADLPSGVALIIVEDGGQNRIAYIPGAARAVNAAQVETAFRVTGPSVVLTTLELPQAAMTALIQTSRAASVPVIVNATPEPAAARDLALNADVLVVNQAELIELLGVPSGFSSWTDGAHRLRQFGPQSVIVTLGSEGALFVDGSGPVRVAAPHVTVVDTTGAGDAFCGALAAQLATGATLAQAVKVGVAAGAVAVTKAGAQPSMPTRKEVEGMLRTMRRS